MAVVVLVAVMAVQLVSVAAAADVAEGPAAQHNLDLRQVSLDVVQQHWELGGAAAVVDGGVQLTPDEQSRVGFVQNRVPLKHVGTKWVLDADLRLSGQGITLFGDGMAVWVTKERFRPGNVFGHAPTWTGLGLFFDTYDNTGGRHEHKHPYVSAMYNDGTLQYFHDESGTHSSQHGDVGCSARIRQYGQDEKIASVRVEYDDSNVIVKLRTGKRLDDTIHAPAFEYLECFRMTGVHIPPGYYVGVSASTGDLTDRHDVLSLSVRGEVGATDDAVPPYIRDAWALTEGPRGDCPALTVHGQFVDAKPSPPPQPQRQPPADAAQGGDAAASAHTQHHALANEAAARRTAQEQEEQRARQVQHEQQEAQRKFLDGVQQRLRDREAAIAQKQQQARQQHDAQQRDNADAQAAPAQGGPQERQLPSAADIDALIADAAVVKLITEQAEANRGKLQLIHDRLDAKAAALHQHLQAVLDSMQRTDDSIEERLTAIEAKLALKVETFREDTAKASSSWHVPFLVLIGVFVAMTFVTYRKYRTIMKTHML